MFGTKVDLSKAQFNDLEPPQNELALTARTAQNAISQLYTVKLVYFASIKFSQFE